MSLYGFFNDIEPLFDQEHLLPIPLFTFAGFLLARSNAPKRLVRFADAILGWAPGGLAIVAVCACTFFTTFTGASGVTIIALGGLLYPILMERKYPEQFSLGLLTASGSLGLLFFPALPVFIFALVYGLATPGQSIMTPANLFMAGLIPGLILTGVLCGYSAIMGVRYKIKRTTFSWSEVGRALKEALGETLLPVFILTTILTGILDINEIATLTCVYLLILEVGIHRDIHVTRDLPKMVADSMILVGAIILIMTVVMPLTGYLNLNKIPEQILGVLEQHIDSRIAFLLALNVFLLIVGCLMDIFSAIVAVVPLLVPFAERYGVHPLHLGVIFLINLEIGYMTPPVGINLFIASFQFKKRVMTVYKSVIPYLLLLFATLMLITYVEPLSLWLPSQFMDQSAEPELEKLNEEQSMEELELEFGEDVDSPAGDTKDNPGSDGGKPVVDDDDDL
jgi:C4-dicarboxylate transporter DctM subunit